MPISEDPIVDYAPEPVEEEFPDPVVLDDPDRSGLAGPAPTEPGIMSTGETVLCPWCGAEVDLFLEPSGQTSNEEFVEECAECCRDFEVRVEYDTAGLSHIYARRTE